MFVSTSVRFSDYQDEQIVDFRGICKLYHSLISCTFAKECIGGRLFVHFFPHAIYKIHKELHRFCDITMITQKLLGKGLVNSVERFDFIFFSPELVKQITHSSH
jgi:hypothetical protein